MHSLISMATGYVLVNVEPGLEFSVFETVKELDKVADATFSILGFARKQNQPECQSSSFSKCFIALEV